MRLGTFLDGIHDAVGQTETARAWKLIARSRMGSDISKLALEGTFKGRSATMYFIQEKASTEQDVGYMRKREMRKEGGGMKEGSGDESKEQKCVGEEAKA